MNFVGIDPGSTGGIAILDESDAPPVAHKMSKDPLELWFILSEAKPAYCVIEKVHAGPSLLAHQAFKFGYGYGVVKTVATLAALNPIDVSPVTWQKDFELIIAGRKHGEDDTSKKNRNKAKAAELFPDTPMYHWNADAILLAEYARRLWREKHVH